jgi:hypothetical protein
MNRLDQETVEARAHKSCRAIQEDGLRDGRMEFIPRYYGTL